MILDGSATTPTDYLTIATRNAAGVTISAAGSTNVNIILTPHGASGALVLDGITWPIAGSAAVGSILAVNSANALSVVTATNGGGNQLPHYNDTTKLIEWVTQSSVGGNSFGIITPSGNSNATTISATTTDDTATFSGGAGIQINGTALSKTLAWSFIPNGSGSTSISGSLTFPFFDGSNIPQYRRFRNFLTDLNIPNNITVNGVVTRTGAGTYTTRTISSSAVAGLEGIGVSNGDGVAGNPTIGLNISGLGRATSVSSSNEFVVYNGTNNVRVTWANVQARATFVQVVSASVTFNGGATQTIATLPNLGRVLRCRFVVDTIWDTVETVRIGISGGSASAIMTVTNDDLNNAGIYETSVDYRNTSSGNQTIQATVTNGNGPTQGSGRVYIEYYGNSTL